MWNVSDQWAEALSATQVWSTKVNLYRGAEVVAEDVAITSGSVTVDGTSNVRRTLDLEVADPDLLTLLDPYAVDARVWRGLRYGNNLTEWCPVGVFRLWDVQQTEPGSSITVNAQDWGALVDGDQFLHPDASPKNVTVVSEIERILEGAGFPGLVDQTGSTELVGERLTWEEGRWDAINALAASLDAVVYFNQIGTPVLAPDQPGDPVWTVDAGETGVLVKTAASVTRDGVYNCVIAEGEHPNGNPVRAIVKDLDPSSPTYWRDDPTAGGFGHSVRKENNAAWNTQAKVSRAATRLLRQSIGKIRTVDVSAVPNPALDAGDVISVVHLSGTTETLVADAFPVPLIGGDFTINSRSRRTLTV